MTDKNSVLKFLKKYDLCVLSTASPEGKTQSAVMAFILKDDFTFLMNSEGNTRKVINIFSNNQASIIVGGLNNDPSVQMDGTIKILDNQEAALAKDFMLQKNPQLANYFSETGKFISFTPLWFRFSDYGQNPPQIAELNLVSQTV